MTTTLELLSTADAQAITQAQRVLGALNHDARDGVLARTPSDTFAAGLFAGACETAKDALTRVFIIAKVYLESDAAGAALKEPTEA